MDGRTAEPEPGASAVAGSAWTEAVDGSQATQDSVRAVSVFA